MSPVHNQMQSPVQNITLLGATGSIGCNTLDVLAQHPHKYKPFALTAWHNTARLCEQCRQHRPRFAVVATSDDARKVRAELGNAVPDLEVLVGEDGLCAVAAHPQVHQVMAAIVGAAGLTPVLAGIRRASASCWPTRRR